MTAHIMIDGVSKSYGALRVLADCTLSVDRGTILTLLGPSGCGKTTLLRTIAGFVDPDAGRVCIGGSDITQHAPNERRVGYVFQNYALFPHLTVAGNVAYGLKVRRVGGAEIAQRVGRALDLVALGGLGDRYPAQLSGGQQQRVAIARALVLEPDVLLLDEPFNALDAALRTTMQVELRKLIERVGITSIFVTHDQAEAMALSDQVAVMRSGHIEQMAPPLDIYDRPRTAYVAGFIGRANLIEVSAKGGRVEGFERIAAPVPDGEAILVVRPENLVIDTGDAMSWVGRVTFATALGGQIEYEVDCGLREPMRVLSQRRAGATPIGPGTPVRVTVEDPDACVVLPKEGV
jgi:putative spermidine/putrescine transport system ATP-binding protein